MHGMIDLDEAKKLLRNFALITISKSLNTQNIQMNYTPRDRISSLRIFTLDLSVNK